jgi:hypothetical protein
MSRPDKIVAYAAVAMVLAGMACGRAASTPNPAATPSMELASPTPPSPTSATAECEAPALEITIGSPVASEITGRAQPPGEKMYYCVRIPEGTVSVTFQLGEVTADLDLFVGHPDLATVQQGGVWFWSSTVSGVENEVIVVEPARSDSVNPGLYYIEVSSEDYGATSPFTLLVSVP